MKLDAALRDLLAFTAEHEGALEAGGPLDALRADAMEFFRSAGMDDEAVLSLAELDARAGRKENRDEADLDAVVAVSRTSFAIGVLLGWRAAHWDDGDEGPGVSTPGA